MLDHRDLTERIIGLAIEVHCHTGPRLLESVYAACKGFELEKAAFQCFARLAFPFPPRAHRYGWASAPTYCRGHRHPEIKAVPALLPAHEAQLLTYPHRSGLSVGLLMNFHATCLKDGLRRFTAS